MKLYTCDNCKNLLYFENSVCLKCGHTLGFDSDKLDIITVQTTDGVIFSNVKHAASRYKMCRNATHGTCNWLVSEHSEDPFCVACQLNRTIPELIQPNVERWHRIEFAKHRLIYSLLRLGLVVKPKQNDADDGLAFDFLADKSFDEHVLTGHDNGVITLNIEEADEAKRVRNKLDLGEKYRTLLGHFRHEIGHYYWDQKIANTKLLTEFRTLFGDESVDYATSLQDYYATGGNPNWMDNFISPYAAAHPWEDWAETWSHYMHLMDTLETAYYFGLDIHPEKQMGVKTIQTDINRDPYTMKDFDQVFKTWLPLTFAVNSLNRSMGHADFYPFIIAEPVVRKLKFIHQVCRG